MLQRFNSVSGLAIEKSMIVCSQRSSSVSDYPSAISQSSNDSFVCPENDETVKVLKCCCVKALEIAESYEKFLCASLRTKGPMSLSGNASELVIFLQSPG